MESFYKPSQTGVIEILFDIFTGVPETNVTKPCLFKLYENKGRSLLFWLHHTFKHVVLVSVASVITYKVVLLGTGKELKYTHYVLANSTSEMDLRNLLNMELPINTPNVILWQRELLQHVNVNRMCCAGFIPCPTEPVKSLLNHSVTGSTLGLRF